MANSAPTRVLGQCTIRYFGNSKASGQFFTPNVPSRTPGSLGCNDQADPNVFSLTGDTPNSVGINDHGTPTGGLSSLVFDTLMALSIVPTSGDIAATVPKSKTKPKAFVGVNYKSYDKSVGDGYCVPLVKEATGAPQTSLWKKGEDLIELPELDPGSAIATFNVEGKYASLSSGNHAAIFVRYEVKNDRNGIVIYDQYREWADSKRSAGKDWEKKKNTETDEQFAERIKKIEAEFPEVDAKSKRRFRRKEPGERFIAFGTNSGNPANDADNYSIIND